MKKYFEYCTYSDTIRLWPENHLVAVNHGARFIADVDSAITDDLASLIFLIVRDYQFSKGPAIATILNDTINLNKY